jgi:hypothetical protein
MAVKNCIRDGESEFSTPNPEIPIEPMVSKTRCFPETQLSRYKRNGCAYKLGVPSNPHGTVLHLQEQTSKKQEHHTQTYENIRTSKSTADNTDRAAVMDHVTLLHSARVPDSHTASKL